MEFSAQMLGRLNLTGDELIANMTRDVKQVFSDMVGMDDLKSVPGAADPVGTFTECVSALIGIAGSYDGLVSLHVPNQLAMKMTSNMLDLEVNECGEEVQDALGELANMVAGSFKDQLDRSGGSVRISPPSVVIGKEYVIHVTGKPEVTTLMFASEEEKFLVAMALDN